MLLCGALTFAMPLVGVPSEWKDVPQFVLGALVIVIAFAYRLEYRRRMRHTDDTLHVEHNPGRAV